MTKKGGGDQIVLHNFCEKNPTTKATHCIILLYLKTYVI